MAGQNPGPAPGGNFVNIIVENINCTYGQSYTPIAKISYGWSYSGTTLPAPTFIYYDTNNNVISKPTEVGIYYIAATSSNSSGSVTSKKVLIVIQLVQVFATVRNTSFPYTGHVQLPAITLSCKNADGSNSSVQAPSYNLYFGNDIASASYPTQVGTYAASIDISAAKNFETANADFQFSFEITQAQATVTLSDTTATYNNAGHAISFTNPSNAALTIAYTDSAGGAVTGLPSNAGTYTATATITDPNYTASSGSVLTATLTIDPASATITLGNLTKGYRGIPQSPSVMTVPKGLSNAITFADSGGSPLSGPPTAVGDYTATATITDSNYTASDDVETFSIVAATGTISFDSTTTTQVYDGTPQDVTAITTPLNLSYDLSYTGTGSTSYGPSSTAPTNVGTYSVTGTITASGYSGTASHSLTITAAHPDIQVSNQQVNYTTAPQGIAVSVSLNLAYTVTYTGTGSTDYTASTDKPTAAGTYSAAIAITDPHGTGSKTVPFTINAIQGAISIDSGTLSQTYDGNPKTITATTTPAGLAYVIGYSTTNNVPPTIAGHYNVTATITDPSADWSGGVDRQTLVIAPPEGGGGGGGSGSSTNQLGPTLTIDLLTKSVTGTIAGCLGDDLFAYVQFANGTTGLAVNPIKLVMTLKQNTSGDCVAISDNYLQTITPGLFIVHAKLNNLALWQALQDNVAPTSDTAPLFAQISWIIQNPLSIGPATISGSSIPFAAAISMPYQFDKSTLVQTAIPSVV